MVRTVKRLGSRKNKHSRRNKMSRRKFRGGGFWDMFSSSKPEVAQLPDRDQVSPQDAYDKKVRGCRALQQIQNGAEPTPECKPYLDNPTYVAPVIPVGVNADYEPSQEEIEKAHQTLMLASKSGMPSMGGGSRRKKYRRRR